MSNYFIPFYKSEIIEYLTRKEDDENKKEKFKEFCRIVEALYHFKYHSKLEKIKKDYIEYDPDSEKFMYEIEEIRNDTARVSKNEVMEGVKELLQAGNYVEITREELERAFKGVSPWGVDLNVEFDIFSSYKIFYRGSYKDKKKKKIFIFNRNYNFNVYSRVVFLFSVKNNEENLNLKPDKIYLKNFKNVPDLDLEMIFPGTKVKIRMIDKLLVGVPLVIGVVSSISKTIQYINGKGTSFELFRQIGFWVLIGGFFIFAIKSYFKYKSTVEKYLKMLAQSLYFQNLDNNSGVFKNLIDDAEEQECKEAIIAYYFLLTEGERSEKELKKRVENFFEEELKQTVCFEVEDAIRKLEEDGIVKRKKEELSAVSIDEALAIIDYKWDNFFKYN